MSQRDITDVVRDQVTPILGAAEARLIADVTGVIIDVFVAHMPNLEDHLVLPALAGILGRMLATATEVQAARQIMIDNGIDILPSLYPGNETILKILHATMGPDPKPHAGELQRRQALAARMADEDFLGTSVVQ